MGKEPLELIDEVTELNISTDQIDLLIKRVRPVKEWFVRA